MALASTSFRLVRKLYCDLVRSPLGLEANLGNIFDSANTFHWPLVLLLTDIYSQALLTMGDDEFFGSSSSSSCAIMCNLLGVMINRSGRWYERQWESVYWGSMRESDLIRCILFRGLIVKFTETIRTYRALACHIPTRHEFAVYIHLFLFIILILTASSFQSQRATTLQTRFTPPTYSIHIAPIKDPFVTNRRFHLIKCRNFEIPLLLFRFLSLGCFEIPKSHKANNYLQCMGKFLVE